MKKILRWMLRGITISSIVIAILAIFTDTSHKQSWALDEVENVVSHQDINGNWMYVIDTRDIQDDENSLCFYTNHQRIRVYAGAELLYERVEEGDLWGDTLGCMWHFVPVPYECLEIYVFVEAVYEDIEDHTLTFYHGDEVNMVKILIRDSMFMTIISGLIILSGVVMILLWIILRRKANIGTSLLHLGCVALVLGGWCYNETDFATLTIPQRMASSFMAYMFLLVLTPAFVLFIREFLKIGSQFMGKVLVVISALEYILVMGMHFLNIRDARENLFIIHIAMGVGVLYVVGCLVLRVIRRELDHRTKLSILGFGILAVAALVDMSSYYVNFGDMTTASGIGFFVFILLMGWESASSAISMMKKGAIAEEYEKMAMMDVLTGLYNRNAYEKDAVRAQKRERLMIVTFDINNLKMCNDMLGHRMGDKYIVEVARCIEDTFESYGKSYRIGGDEFCCIIDRANRCPIKKLIAKIEKRSWVFKNEERVFVGAVACGYAVYEPKTDHSIEVAREKADEFMYRRKREFKEARKNA